MKNGFIDLNSFLSKHKYGKGPFVDYLKEEGYLEVIGENTLKSTSKYIEILDNKNIFIDESKIYKLLLNNKLFNDMIITESHNIPIYSIDDYILRRKGILEASRKRIMFLDFEFVLNQYYEVAFQIFEDGNFIQKGYFLEELAVEKSYLISDDKYFRLAKIQNKTIKLKEDSLMKKEFSIMKRNKINVMLKDILKDIDFLIVHNCSSELKILKENNILFKKSKCICTDYLFQHEIKVKKQNGDFKEHLSLLDLVNHFKIKIDKARMHYAYYDVELLKEVFFKMIDYFKKKEK